MAKSKKVKAAEDLSPEIDWLEQLKSDVLDITDKDGTQKELRATLVRSYIDSLKGHSVKDPAKVIETILKIAPAKADPVDSELEEPVATVSHAEKMISKVKKPRLVSSESILQEGEKEKLSATVSMPYRSGDPIVYNREAPRDAMEEAIEEVALGRKRGLEPKYIREEFNPDSLMQEQIPGEKMTMEHGMTFDQIRHNVEDAEGHEAQPRESTESIKEIYEINKKRSSAPRPRQELPRDEAKEKAKRDWAEFQAKLLAMQREEDE